MDNVNPPFNVNDVELFTSVNDLLAPLNINVLLDDCGNAFEPLEYNKL